MQARWGTHGDHPIIALTPSSVQECVDNSQVTEVKPRSTNLYSLPITRTTRTQFGSEQSANVVALGVVASLSGQLPWEKVLQAVQQRAPKGTADRNIKALELGWQMGMEAGKVMNSGGINEVGLDQK